MSAFDFGNQSVAHLQMLLGYFQVMWGLPAQIFSPQTYNNPLNSIYPEFDPEFTEATTGTSCLVLLSSPVEGLNISGDFISLSDKVTKEYVVTTTTTLHLEDQLLVTFPDSKELNLRITECLSWNPLSTVAFQYRAIVT